MQSTCKSLHFNFYVIVNCRGVKHIHKFCSLLFLNGNSKYSALQNTTPFLKHGTSVSTHILPGWPKTLHKTPDGSAGVVVRSWHRSTQRQGHLVFVSDLISAMGVAKLYSHMAFSGGPVAHFVPTVQTHENRSNVITKNWTEKEHTRLRH